MAVGGRHGGPHAAILDRNRVVVAGGPGGGVQPAAGGGGGGQGTPTYILQNDRHVALIILRGVHIPRVGPSS